MLYFIVNLTSRTGKAKDIWNSLQKDLIKSGIPYQIYKTKYHGHASKLAEEICKKEDNDKCIVVFGGDGTMNEVINGITDFDNVRLGIIPTGSGNDFGRGLKLSKNPVENLNNICDNIKKGIDNHCLVDLGVIRYGKEYKKTRLFAISSGMGMDAIVCKMALTSKLKKVLNKIKIGKLTYVLLTIYSLFSMKTTDGVIRMYADNKCIEEKIINKLIFSCFMNLKMEGGGVPMAPNATYNNNKITLCTAFGIPKWRTFCYLPFLLAAKHSNIKGFYIRECDCIEVELDDPFVVHADGEYCGEHQRLKVECLKGKLKLLN